MLTTLGSLLKTARIDLPKKTTPATVAMATTRSSARQTLSTCLQRGMLRAPKAWPTKVVQAWLKEFSRL